MAATFGLLSALNIGSLRAADVKWNPGFQPRAGAPKMETVTNGNHRLTSNGYSISGYMLLGWSDRLMPLVISQATEDRVQPHIYRLGNPINIQADRTLYAVWAIDKNSNGIPDYKEASNPLGLDREFIQKILADLEKKRRAAESGAARFNLRSAAVSLPAWNIKDDILAYEDKVFFVGCPYNLDTTLKHKITEPWIAFYASNSFGGEAADRVIAAEDMELVFEYGGVLEDSCLVGGTDQKPIKRIPFPKAPSSGDTVKANELFSSDPMEFTRIKEDGEAVLKMYFVKKGTDTLANANDTSFFKRIGNSVPASQGFRGQGKPFINKETGEYTDTLTFRFLIYNRPEFAATTIRSRVSYGDTMRLNYGHLRGTPLKYMMRSLDGGWNWHPADSPLTDVERDLLQDDSVRVCLRQLDKAVGWAAYQKETFVDPERYTIEQFNKLQGMNSAQDKIEYESIEIPYLYFKRLYKQIESTWPYVGSIKDTIIARIDDDPGFGGGPGTYASMVASYLGTEDEFFYTQGFRYALMNIELDPTHDLYNLLIRNTHYVEAQVDDILHEEVVKNLNTVFGKKMADRVAVPDWCRDETYCFYVKRDAPPVHQRSVFIPTVEGVTVVSPGVGYTSIPSQKNFTFRVKYTGEPMTVTAKRLIDGRTVEVLTGTLNADGEYEYVIRRVMQDLTLEFTKTVANTLVDQPSVWANSGAVRIHAPKETTVRIYSASGVLVKQATVQGDKTVPLAAGLYLVVLSDGTTQKVLVQ